MFCLMPNTLMVTRVSRLFPVRGGPLDTSDSPKRETDHKQAFTFTCLTHFLSLVRVRYILLTMYLNHVYTCMASLAHQHTTAAAHNCGV